MITETTQEERINSPNPPMPLKGKVYGELKVTTPSLNYDQQRMFSTLLNRYAYVFAKHEFDIGTSTIMKHSIQLKDNKPIKQRAYRTSHKLIEESDRQITQWLETGINRPSSSPWASPMIMVKKKEENGEYVYIFAE